MTFSPLLQAPLVIQFHAVVAMLALILGTLQLLLRKGTQRHKIVGYIWVSLMLAIAVSSFFIHQIRLVGPFSPIHLLSILTLVTVPSAVLAARRGNIRAHRRGMLILYWAALVGAGLFTLEPSRIIGQMIFGT